MIRPLLILALSIGGALAAPKKVAVFVALCDNASQGIIPVPAKIGDGNKPEDNLYWGCTEGLPTCLKAGKSWKLLKKEVPTDTRILARCIFTDTAGTVELAIEGWRGSEIGACLTAFETALVSGNHDLRAAAGASYARNQKISTKAGTGVFFAIP